MSLFAINFRGQNNICDRIDGSATIGRADGTASLINTTPLISLKKMLYRNERIKATFLVFENIKT
jgi:hypothetical protein